MSAYPAHARLWDRLYAMAAIVLSIFVLSGVALTFQEVMTTWAHGWPEENSSLHPWLATFHVLHSQSVWLRVLILPLLVWTSMVFAFEGRRAAVYARFPEPPDAIPQRVYQSTVSLVKPLFYAAPLWTLYIVSGVFLLFYPIGAETGERGVFFLLAHLHAHPEVDVILPWLALLIGHLFCLFLVWIARIRAARLAAMGVQTARFYEDLPQGAVLGMISAVLVSWIALAWGAPLETMPLVCFAVAASVCVSHVAQVVAESPSWRFLPFGFVAAIVIGDVVRGAAFQQDSLQLWGFSLVSAFFMVLIARLHRRALYAEGA